MLLQSKAGSGVLGVLDSLRCGGFLLDFRGRVLSLNLIAFSCLGDGLILGGEHLSACDRDADHRLQGVVGEALKSSQAWKPRAVVALPRRERLPLMLRVVRLDEYTDRIPQMGNLLLLTVDPETWPEPPREILMQAFGLTPAEADVAIGIGAGRTLAQIAAERGVKVGTVCAHSKTVFSKTQTRGQAELTGLLTRLAFLGAPPGEAVPPRTAEV